MFEIFGKLQCTGTFCRTLKSGVIGRFVKIAIIHAYIIGFLHLYCFVSYYRQLSALPDHIVQCDHVTQFLRESSAAKPAPPTSPPTSPQTDSPQSVKGKSAPYDNDYWSALKLLKDL